MIGNLIAITVGLAFIGFTVLIIPRRIIRVALQNCKRQDGSRSRRRTVGELMHLGNYLASLLVVLVAVAILASGSLAAVHQYIVPIPIIVDVMEAFDPDPATWEAKIENGELGDIGAKYEHWGWQQGYSKGHLRFWEELLWENWFFLAFCGMLLVGFLYWFVIKCYVTAAVRYAQGVLKRRHIYIEWDFVHPATRHPHNLSRI